MARARATTRSRRPTAASASSALSATPGWLCHWGDAGQELHDGNFGAQIESLTKSQLSYVMYVAHGGTSSGFNSGANGGPHSNIQPQITC